MQLPPEMIRNITHVLGDQGRAWLDRLPSLLRAVEEEYGLTMGEPFELSYNYVARASLRDGADAVLKLSPHGDDFRHEVQATRYFDGHGMARLLAADEDRGIALLERLVPGTMLVDLDLPDQRKTEIAAGLMRDLRRPPPADHGLPTARDWFAAFAKHREEHSGAGPLPEDVFERSEATYRDLLQSYNGPPVLLHGDLHHYNILSAQRAPWLAIDPHGLVGEPAFEVGAFFGNPLHLTGWPDLARILERRSHILAERLELDRERVIAWGMSYQVLSAVWSAEHGGTGWGRAIHVAQILSEMK